MSHVGSVAPSPCGLRAQEGISFPCLKKLPCVGVGQQPITLYSLFGDFLLILRLFKDVAFTFIGRKTLQICYVPNMETNMKLKCMELHI